jgi:hypothetical protein
MEYLRNDYDISRIFTLAQQILILHLRLLWSTEIKIGLGATIPNLSKIVVAHGGKSQKKSKQNALTCPDCVIRLLMGPGATN